MPGADHAATFSLVLLSERPKAARKPRLPAVDLDGDAPGVQFGAPFQGLFNLALISVGSALWLHVDIALPAPQLTPFSVAHPVGCWQACMILAVPHRFPRNLRGPFWSSLSARDSGRADVVAGVHHRSPWLMSCNDQTLRNRVSEPSLWIDAQPQILDDSATAGFCRPRAHS